MVKNMRTALSLFLSALLLVAGLAYAQDNAQTYQIDEQATAQALWKVGEIIAEGEIPLGRTDASKVYRKFIGITNKGYFVVQDFYQESHKKTIDPVVITQKDFVTDISQSFTTYPFDSMFISWFDNEQKAAEGLFQDGQRQGLWTWWYDNGQKWLEGEFLNNKKQGLWTTWNRDGKKISETMFEAGEVNEKKTFD